MMGARLLIGHAQGPPRVVSVPPLLQERSSSLLDFICVVVVGILVVVVMLYVASLQPMHLSRYRIVLQPWTRCRVLDQPAGSIHVPHHHNVDTLFEVHPELNEARKRKVEKGS